MSAVPKPSSIKKAPTEPEQRSIMSPHSPLCTGSGPFDAGQQTEAFAAPNRHPRAGASALPQRAAPVTVGGGAPPASVGR
jgi:hypothetical protein